MDSDYRNTALTITAAMIISFTIYVILYISIVPSYLHSTNREVNIFNFYDCNHNNNNIFFWDLVR